MAGLSQFDEDVRIKLISSVMSIGFLLLIGTFIYHNLEGWSFIDSFYFTGVTITTLGYGDLYPTSDISKIITVFFSLIGIGIALYAITSIGHEYFEKREEKLIRKLHSISFRKDNNSIAETTVTTNAQTNTALENSKDTKTNKIKKTNIDRKTKNKKR